MDVRGLSTNRSRFPDTAVVLLAIAWLTGGSVRADGQEEQAPRVTSVVFSGLSEQEAKLARATAKVRVGEPYNDILLKAARSRLVRTGRYVSVRSTTQPEGDGVKVTFHLLPRKVVKSISFEGNKRFSDAKLREQITQKVGQPVDLFAIRDGRESLLTVYREGGYSDVAIEYDESRLKDSGELVYTIREGVRVRIRKILFEGNHGLSARELKRQIETKRAWWIIRSGSFDQERVEADAIRIQSYYRDRGFLDARVGFRRELSANGRKLTLVFTIEEGTRYRIESIELRGIAAFSREELLALMQSRVGEVVNRRQVASDVKAVQDAYGRRGYIYAAVRPIQVFSNRPGFVRLTLEITEGSPFHVGRIVVRGNTRTRDKVVRRALNLYPPDDLLDLTEVRAAERRLRDTRVFSSARVYPVGDAPDYRDILIDVQETEKAGDFIFGFGVTSNSGLVGNIVLDLQNFDITDVPRSLSELIKLRSFFGGGQRLRLELQPGTDLSRFRLDFTEPYFRDRPTIFNASAYLFNRGRDGYDERRGGTIMSWRRHFERGLWQGWTGELAFRVEDASVRSVALLASNEIREDKGSNLLTTLKGTLVRDRTDNRFVPTTGDRMSLSYEQFGILGGDHRFGKLTTDYTWYKTVASDAFERKSVLKLRARGGAIIGDAPITERFFAGGTGSLRGFAFRGVGERDGIERNNIGGDFLLLLGGEYTFPLIGDNVRGLVFLDTGTAGSGAYRAAIGAGVRFTLQIGRPIPLELDLALPFSSDSEDDKQAFSFLIGSIF